MEGRLRSHAKYCSTWTRHPATGPLPSPGEATSRARWQASQLPSWIFPPQRYSVPRLKVTQICWQADDAWELLRGKGRDEASFTTTTGCIRMTHCPLPLTQGRTTLQDEWILRRFSNNCFFCHVLKFSVITRNTSNTPFSYAALLYIQLNTAIVQINQMNDMIDLDDIGKLVT